MSDRANEGHGHWNRAGRRSGGSRPVRPTPRPDGGAAPALSIQCFEKRHADCGGKCGLFPGACECPCHRPTETNHVH